jgi:hypothetical protein
MISDLLRVAGFLISMFSPPVGSFSGQKGHFDKITSAQPG